MKSQRFPSLLYLSFPVPMPRSSARAAGRGRGESRAAAPGPGCWRRRQPLPLGPVLGGQVARAAPTTRACGSRRDWPATKLPSRLVEIFLLSWFPLLSPAVRELSTSSCQARSHLLCKQNRCRVRDGAGGGRREADSSAPAPQARPYAERCTRSAVGAPPLPARAASPSSGGERRRRRLGVTFRAPFSLPACRGGP